MPDRPTALDQCSKILVLANGTQQAFGPSDAVLRKAVVRPLRPAVAGNLALQPNQEAIS